MNSAVVLDLPSKVRRRPEERYWFQHLRNGIRTIICLSQGSGVNFIDPAAVPRVHAYAITLAAWGMKRSAIQAGAACSRLTKYTAVSRNATTQPFCFVHARLLGSFRDAAARAVVDRAIDQLSADPSATFKAPTDQSGSLDSDVEHDALTWKSVVVGTNKDADINASKWTVPSRTLCGEN